VLVDSNGMDIGSGVPRRPQWHWCWGGRSKHRIQRLGDVLVCPDCMRGSVSHYCGAVLDRRMAQTPGPASHCAQCLQVLTGPVVHPVAGKLLAPAVKRGKPHKRKPKHQQRRETEIRRMHILTTVVRYGPVCTEDIIFRVMREHSQTGRHTTRNDLHRLVDNGILATGMLQNLGGFPKVWYRIAPATIAHTEQ